MTFGVPAHYQEHLVSAGRGRAGAMLAQRVLGSASVLQRLSSRRFEIGDRLHFRCDLARGLQRWEPGTSGPGSACHDRRG